MRAPRVLALVAALAAAGGAGAETPPSLSGSVTAAFSGWEDRGSAFAAAGSARPWTSTAAAEGRLEAGDVSRCALEAELALDASTGEIAYRVRELWAEWRPGGLLGLRLGRQRLGFGSGYAWNPSNDFDPRRDPADPQAARNGIDAIQLRLDAGGLAGFPLSLSAVAQPPTWARGIDLEDSRLGLQAYAYLGELELMLVGSAAKLSDPEAAWLAGGWATLGLGPAVLGLEAAARKRSEAWHPDARGLPEASEEVTASASASLNLRGGDFGLVGELYWNGAAYTRDELDAMLDSPLPAVWASALALPGSVGTYHGLVRAFWSRQDLSLAIQALADLEVDSWLASGELGWAADEATELRLRATLPGPRETEPRDELDLSRKGWELSASISVHF